MSGDSIDSKVEVLCSKILSTDSEFWEIRNKAVMALTALISQYEGAETSRIAEVFNANVFRLLKDPIKDIISDLRSQQIRDICLFLMKFSEVTKDHMKLLLREIFCFILDGVKVPNRVMSGYVDNAILTIIKNTTFKSCIPSLVSEIRDSKAKMVRERCLEYLNEILIHWEITEKEADVIADAIRSGLEDAAVRGREIARMAYLNLHLLFPKKTEKIKANIPVSLRQRLLKSEVERIGPILQAQALAQKKMQNKAQAASASVVNNVTASSSSVNNGNNNNGNNNSASSGISSNGAAPITEPAEPEALITISPVKIANLRARRLSCEDSAVASIQALIRGRKCRRQTMSMHISGDSEYGGSVASKSPERLDKYEDLISSPSLTSRAPFSKPFTSMNGMNRTDNGRNGGSELDSGLDLREDEEEEEEGFDAENETSLLGLLKVKTTMMMNFVNEQLTFIEGIERERNSHNDDPKTYTGSTENMEKIMETSLRISRSEIDINKEFQKRIAKLRR